MRYPASEKLEIIRTVEQSSLGVRRTLQQVGIPRSTFYNWYDRYVSEGFDGLEDKKPDPGPVWNKVPEDIAQQLVRFALAESDLSPRELAVRFTEERRYYLSESTVYRVLKSHDLITAPAFIGELSSLLAMIKRRSQYPGRFRASVYSIATSGGVAIWREPVLAVAQRLPKEGPRLDQQLDSLASGYSILIVGRRAGGSPALQPE